MKYELIPLLILILLIGLAVIAQNYAKDRYMDNLCIKAGGTKMSDSHSEWGYIKFKCEGRGDTIFETDFKECKTDEWGDNLCTFLNMEEDDT